MCEAGCKNYQPGRQSPSPPVYQTPGSPSAASGPRQIWVPKPIELVRFDGVTTGVKNVRFRVPTPDSRVRVNVALLGVPDPGGSATFLATKSLTLLFQAIADAIDGGMTVPVTNLPDPSVAQPFPIPEAVQLGGFAYEAVTIGDAIEGTVTVTGVADAVKGRLVLQARYQPDGQRLPWDEWTEIKAQCNPGALSPRIVIG